MLGLPIGYWKGAGLSLLLDLLASTLSGGKSTSDLSKLDDEIGVSQVFIVFNVKKLANAQQVQQRLENIIAYFKSARPLEGSAVLYPGERVLRRRAENLKNGIPVQQKVWQNIKALSH